MANRLFIPPLGSLEVGVVKLWCSITVGATGAVTTSSGKGIASVTRNSAGNYTVALSDTYNSLLHASWSLLHSASSDPATVGVFMRTASQAVSSGTAPAVVLQCFTGDDGAAADPASGAVITAEFTLKNSSV